MEDITIEKIRESIKENLNKAKEQQLNTNNILGDKNSDNHNTVSSPGRTAHVNDLLRLDGEQFIKEIYKNILLREPDTAGLENYLNLIKKGISKETILYTIAASPEAKGKQVKVAGLENLNLGWKHRLKQTLKRIPVASNLISWSYKLIKLPSRFHELNDDYIIHKAEVIKKEIMMQEEFAKRDRILQEEIAKQKEEIIKKERAIYGEILKIDRLREEKDSAIMNALLEKDKVMNGMNRQLLFTSRKLEMLDYELKKRTGLDINQTIKEIANKDFSPESYTYFAFENTFRGSREMIKKRQTEYLDYITEAHKKSGGDYLLDIGCGRGELLEILSENNIPSKGIDINEENITFCKEINLSVELSDALKFMSSLKDNSLIGVTAFQVVEHLNTEYLIEFIKGSFQKIKDGGVIILETVNPFSLSSLMNFFTDLTHKNPIPPITLKFLSEASGFTEVEIKYSSPIPDNMKLKGDDENTKILNGMIFGFQDYAVIGRKGLL